MLINDPLSGSLEKKATRDGYGDALVEAGSRYPSVVVLEADLSGSTKTKGFAKKFPERFYNFGVAEQNLVGNAAGMALAGLTPVASSFAMFLSGRAWEIVRNSVAYPGLNVKLAATHAGITLGEDGASHQIIEDVAIMRAIPGMTVLVPADYHQAKAALFAALEHKGPVYIRYGRPNVPMIYGPEDRFEIGKGHVIQEGQDVAFIANGVMVFEAWKAARLIEKQKGLRPWVVNFASVKPLDTAMLDLLAAKGVKTIYTMEEHNVLGGLGSAVAEYVSEHHAIRVKRIGMQDVFGQSGTPSGLMEHYGLTAEKLAANFTA